MTPETEGAMADPPTIAVRGELGRLDAADERVLLERGRANDAEVAGTVTRIVASVRMRGDAALLELAERHDGVRMDSVEVPRAACDTALRTIDPAVAAALRSAAGAIARFHEAQRAADVELETYPGVRVGLRSLPLRRVGVYAPGGRAAYPSSVLMGVVPARAAGVSEVIVCSPPGPDGVPPTEVLAACALAGADRVFAIGGAGAIAAMAFGTHSVPRVDRIVGPGNAYVTEAKRQLHGVVGTDSPAGPSEILILADAGAEPRLAAVELLAQAEHDPDASAVLVSTDAAVIDAVYRCIAELLAELPRAAIIRTSLAERGALLLAADMDEAVAFAERYAPEHLLLMTHEPRALLPRLRNAGSVFLGGASSVAFGDYMTGANHVLPTNGLARSLAGLSTADFVRTSTYQELTAAGAAALSAATTTLATAERLEAHALAASMRLGAAHAAPSGTVALPRRAAYAHINLYDPGRAPIDVDLSDNTNLWGPNPAVLRAVRAATEHQVARYPSVYADELKRRIAAHHGVEPANVVTGCGSDDILDSAVRAFAEPGSVLAFPDPTFGMVSTFARMNGVRPVAVPLDAGFAMDPDRLVAARAPVTYVCNPNNPSGTVFPRAVLDRLGRDAHGVVLLDEAYADFAGDDYIADAIACGRMLVVRTFSKAFGLAGLRVGYALAASPVVREVEKSRGPYKVGGVAEAAALAALADVEWMRTHVAAAVAARAELEGRLDALGFECWPSRANFVLIRLPAGTAAGWNEQLRARGVAARPFANLRGAGECLRVTVGPRPMMDRFVTAIGEARRAMEGSR